MQYKIVFIILFFVGATVRALSLAKTPRWWKDKDRTAKNHQPAAENLLMIPVFLGMQVTRVTRVTRFFDITPYGSASWGSERRATERRNKF